MDILTVLQEAGLNAKQAAVYAATLEMGSAPALRIALKAGIKRTTAYVILSELHEMGLVEVIPRGATTLYQAVDPENLVSDMKEKAAHLEAALPQLRAIANLSTAKPAVRFYEGKQAILSLYKNEIFRQKEIFSIVTMREVRQLMSARELDDVLAIMKDSSTHIRDLVEMSPEARAYVAKKEKLGLGETKHYPRSLQFAVDYLIYGNKFAMISPRNLIAIVIEDEKIARSQRQLLEFLWHAI